MRGTATPLTKGPFSITLPDTAGPLTIPADGSGSGLLDNLLPWIENVDVFMTATNTNWSTFSQSSSHVYNYIRESSGAQNDSVEFDVGLSAGTWTFEILHNKFSSCGIASVQLDGVQVGTVDMYNATTAANSRSQVTGIAVATTGKKRLKLVMSSKNASSSGYTGTLQHIQCKRTA